MAKAKPIFASFLLGMGLTYAQAQSIKEPNPIPSTLPWKLSLIPVAATTALDIQSSLGRYELNPIMGPGEFQFSHQGAKKLYLVGGMVGAEYFIIRQWPKTAKYFTRLNIGYSMATGLVVGVNYGRR